MALNTLASLFVDKKSLQFDQQRSMLFFALICIFQASLQYICWTFQGARVFLEHQSIQSVANFFVVFILVGAFTLAIIAPAILSSFGKKSFIFAIALALQTLSFWSILIPDSTFSFFVFAAVNGAGSGMFLFARHLLELMRTNNGSGVRDKFNASVAAVNQLMLILLPFFIAASATLISIHFPSLDTFVPVIFLLSFLLVPATFLCFQIPDHFPQFSISKKHYFSLLSAFKASNFLSAKMYLLSYGAHWALRNFVIAVAGALIAKNISTIGTSEATGAFVAWILLLFLQRFAKPSLRQQLFYVGAIGLGFAWIFLGFYPTLFAFFLLAVAKALFNPLLEVGTHLYTQHITEYLCTQSQRLFLLDSQKNSIAQSHPTGSTVGTDTSSTEYPVQSHQIDAQLPFANSHTCAANTQPSFYPDPLNNHASNYSPQTLNIQFLVGSLIVRELYISFWRIAFLLLVPFLISSHSSFEQLSTISILFALSCFLLPILGHLFFGSFDDTSISSVPSTEQKFEALSRDDSFIHPSFFPTNQSS